MEITPKSTTGNPVYLSPCDSVGASPCENRQKQPHQKLSSSLRERLKRSRRSFTSPFSVAKRLCVDEDDDGGSGTKEIGQQVSAESISNPPLVDKSDVDVNRNDTKSASERFSGPVPEDLVLLRDRLRREVKDKTETLRRLKMVQMYRSKNDLMQLQSLIDKWRSCAQAALYELQSGLQIDGQKGSLSQVIDLCGLEDGILHFDRTEEDFTS